MSGREGDRLRDMWRREIFERELERTNEFTNLINKVTLKQGVKDKWRWKTEKDRYFRTKTTYCLIAFGTKRQTRSQDTKHLDMVWSKYIPLKVAATR